MGCFSFLCKECGRPICSDSSRGEEVFLILLKNGSAIETMSGEYDSYGRVFDENYKSIEWDMPWDEVCNLMFSEDKGNGIAAIHQDCFQDVPTTRSEDDPNQGWGKFQTADGQWFNLDYEDFQDDD